MKKLLVTGVVFTALTAATLVEATTITGEDQQSNMTNPQFSKQQMVGSMQSNAEQQPDGQQLGLPQQVKQQHQEIQQLQGLVQSQEQTMEQLQIKVQALEQTINSGASKDQSQSSTSNTSDSGSTNQSNTSSSSSDTGDNLEGQAVYLQAYQLIQQKKYTPAKSLLKRYLKDSPKGNYVVNAHYWLGEIYAVEGDADSALKEFTTVVNKYPKSNKVPDAMLKLGIINYSKNQYDQAKHWYKQLMSQYPDSSAAQVASTELQQIQKAGY